MGDYAFGGEAQQAGNGRVYVRRAMSGFEVLKAERSSMKFSFIIPAKDEWAYLPETLRRLRASRERDGLDFDVIVVLADSAELALCADADIVICESAIGTRATIARARNLGAAQSRAPIAMPPTPMC